MLGLDNIFNNSLRETSTVRSKLGVRLPRQQITGSRCRWLSLLAMLPLSTRLLIMEQHCKNVQLILSNGSFCGTRNSSPPNASSSSDRIQQNEKKTINNDYVIHSVTISKVITSKYLEVKGRTTKAESQHLIGFQEGIELKRFCFWNYTSLPCCSHNDTICS